MTMADYDEFDRLTSIFQWDPSVGSAFTPADTINITSGPDNEGELMEEGSVEGDGGFTSWKYWFLKRAWSRASDLALS